MNLSKKHKIVKESGILKWIFFLYVLMIVIILIASIASKTILINQFLGITGVFIFILLILYFLFPNQRKAFLNTSRMGSSNN